MEKPPRVSVICSQGTTLERAEKSLPDHCQRAQPQPISAKPPLPVRRQKVTVKRFFLHQRAVLNRTAPPGTSKSTLQTQGGGVKKKNKQKKKRRGGYFIFWEKPKFLTLLRLPPVPNPLSSCFTWTRSAQHGRAASLRNAPPLISC